jgi:hypothetical protein
VILLKPTIVDPSLEDADLRRDALQRLLDWTDTLPAKVTTTAPSRGAAAPAAPATASADRPAPVPVPAPIPVPVLSFLSAPSRSSAPAAPPSPSLPSAPPSQAGPLAAAGLNWSAMGAASQMPPAAVPARVPRDSARERPLARPPVLQSAGPSPAVPAATAWRKPAAPAFVFVSAGAAGAARAAAAARAVRPKVDAPWVPLVQRSTLWSTPVPSQPLRAAALRQAARG